MFDRRFDRREASVTLVTLFVIMGCAAVIEQPSPTPAPTRGQVRPSLTGLYYAIGPGE